MKKVAIEDRAISGLKLNGEDVAALSRNGKHLTLRHVWPESVDARVWDGVRRAFMSWAQEIADASGKSVEIYSKHGDLLEQVRTRDVGVVW